MKEEGILWKERKRNFLGLPWTFTVYSLSEDSLNVKTGFLSQHFEEVRLYRVRDFTVNKSFIQRIFGLGTLHICSADSTTPELDLVNIRNVMEAKKIIANQVEAAKTASGIKTSEFISDRPEGGFKR